MEEVENRLYSNNPISVSNLTSKLVLNIKKKHENGIKDFPEIKFLKQKFMSADTLISEVSGIAIKQLIKDGILSVEHILTDLLSTINSAKCYPTLINLLGDLLYLQSKNKTNYNLSSPQHPFITLIIENDAVSNHIINKIINLKEEDHEIHKIFLPFYLYVLCCPTKNSVHLVKCRLWSFLLSSDCVNTVPMDFYKCILCWFQVEKREDLQVLNDQLLDALQISLVNKKFLNSELLILWQINAVYNLAKHKLDMQHTLNSLKKILLNKKLAAIDSILIILSQVIDICSPLYLERVFNLCQLLIDQNDASIYSLQTVKASVLQWLSSPCIITDNSTEVAKNLLTKLSECHNIQKNSELSTFAQEHNNEISTNKNIFISINISLHFERFHQEEYIRDWITEIKKTPQEFLLDIFNVLCGLLLIDHKNVDIATDVLDILLKCVEVDVSLSPKLLTLLFYKISNNQHPKFHFAVLKALPKMVILRDNIPKVIATIQAVSRGSENLYNMSLSLAYDAWEIEHKCYPYLEDLLVSNSPAKKKWERYVTKAHILKGLCEKKPESYGKDIIAHLSKILNECDDTSGALPCSIAIEAITILCRAGVINIKTTWANLSPKFKNDFRYPVVKSLCSLIKEIPQLSYTEPYQDLFDEVTQTLWQYVDFGDSQISEVALLSLASFGMEHISQTLPEKYLEPGSSPNLASITGKTWIHFLIENSASTASLNFIKKMMSNEIDEYLKYVYQNKGAKEPVNYSYLPPHSVVRAIGEFIKTWANKWRGSIHDKLYLECLKIFSIEFSKPLPPLDWCFLQELIHDTKTKEHSIDIASHQVVLSGTARRLVENYVIAATEKPQDEDINNIFRNLKFLARSIQPMILRPFFESSIWYAIKKYNQNEPNLMNNISKYLKIVLKLPEVQETNKLTIVQVLDNIIFVTDIDSELFTCLCETITAASSDCLKESTSVKVAESLDSFKKSAKIRCLLAKTSSFLPLVWLDDVIEVWSNSFRDLNLWPDLASVFQTHVTNPGESVAWLLELIGQIQAKIADRCHQPVVCHLFDVLVFAVDIFSGNFVFANKNDCDIPAAKRMFPQSLASLLDRPTWEICSIQVLEWLYHMNTEECVPKDYRKIFGICLQALKHNEEFVKNQRWMKYLNSCTNF